MHTIPGAGGMYHGGWYWIVNEKGTHKLLNELELATPINDETVVPKDKNQEILINNKKAGVKSLLTSVIPHPHQLESPHS